ncbi:MAG TPA: efflux RND transporter permease subunit [Bacteroidales bacterium]|nr:efflux RND transporter permease subunit [Bacteroidales bacterium]
MSIYSNAVKRPLTTILIFVALIVMGMYSLINLPVDLYPELEPPFVSVLTMYSGASASDIESNVTELIENSLNSVSNLKDISSVSSDNTSIMFLEFKWGHNLDEAANEIRDALSFIEPYLPEDCEKPTILKFNSSMMPILFMTATADESYRGLEKILEEKLVNPLNRIEGVGSVGISGAPGRRIYIDVDPRKMEAYNLSIEQIGNILRMENLNTPAGFVEMGSLDYPLRIQGEFSDSEYLSNLVIGSNDGTTIFLKDIADINDKARETKLEEKVNGNKGVRMFVQKQSGANTVDVTKKVYETIDEIMVDLPADVKIQTIWDSAEFITGSISNLTTTLLFAGIFVILVVLFFLGRWRATFIVILTIPISLIVAFIYLFISGNSINIISLSSLSIAIGMVVDDAIVVLENITRHIERGSRPREAAIYATNEVWLAVIVTTLTIVAVFFPLTFVGGMTGVLFKPLGIIVTLTVITSTVAAITLTPTMSSLMLKVRPKTKKPKALSYDNTIRRGLNKLDSFYERTLRWALMHKSAVSVMAILIFAGSMLLMSQVGTEFIPESDQSILYTTIELQTGVRADETFKIASKLDTIVQEYIPEAELVATSSGADDSGGFAALFGSGGVHVIAQNIKLVPIGERSRSVWELAEILRNELEKIPEVVNYSVTTTGQGMGFGGNTIDVEIYGYDINQTNAVAEDLELRMKSVEGAKDIQISRDKSKPELQIVLDQEKMMLHGLNTATVSNAVRNRIQGMTATRLRQFGEEYDIVVRFKEEYRNSLTEVKNISLMSPLGQLVRLGEIAEIKEFWAPPNIEHKRKERIVTVSATPYKRAIGEMAIELQGIIEEMEVPEGVQVQLSGTIQEQQEAFADLGLLMLLSIVLVYLVMASQFESLKMPFIIMFSIPFAFSGVALALFITGTTLSVIAAIGAVMLIGIVVKNAIVLVDYINLMRDRGMELYEAVATSGRLRLRPVLMTSSTTILGMLPLAMSVGEGSEIWSPMGISVIGGLIFSTLVTMVLVPVVYVIFARRGERNRKRRSL